MFTPHNRRYANAKGQINRWKWQCDYAQWLAAAGIEQDWGGEREEGRRPVYLRQANRMIPCACQTCYFCLAKITTGVAHRQGARQRDHDAALNAIPHKWTAVSCNKCGWCLDKRRAAYTEEAASVSRGAVSNSSKVTCLKCDPAGRPLCKKCRNSAAAEHDH